MHLKIIYLTERKNTMSTKSAFVIRLLYVVKPLRKNILLKNSTAKYYITKYNRCVCIQVYSTIGGNGNCI